MSWTGRKTGDAFGGSASGPAGETLRTTAVPDVLPVLSRGRHQRPRHGACFMELASVLAGERWTDHPRCTHPVLAELARQVNDSSGDKHRSELAVLVPSVVGLNGPDTDLRWTIGLTSAIAVHAVDRVPRSTQRSMVAGLLTLRRAVADRHLEGVPGTEGIDGALADAPDPGPFIRLVGGSRAVGDRALRSQVAPAVCGSAVRGLVVANEVPDRALRTLLEVALGVAERLQAAEQPATSDTADAPRATATRSR